MNEFSSMIVSNHIINVGLIAWASAQLMKTLLTFLKYRQFRPERLVGAGGMPSSHSALVCSLTVAIAQSEGYGSPLFALSLFLAAIVMYDAMGVRRAAGEQAKVLNKMMFGFKDLSKIFQLLDDEIEEELESHTEEISEHKELKEFLGHTPLEVLGGALLGILVASIMH